MKYIVFYTIVDSNGTIKGASEFEYICEKAIESYLEITAVRKAAQEEMPSMAVCVTGMLPVA